jgi:glycine cleavage system T protein (aminomethyltransferase)
MSQGTETLKRTPLHDRHVAAGARLVPYAGWEMPVQYAGIREEHKAVRNHVGIFDVSHMGEIETDGPEAEAFLQHILSNDVTKIAADGAQYSVLCNEAGGVLDDLFTYRLGHDRFLTVTNAANHEKDLAWFQRHAGDFDVNVHDRISDYAMLAIQGPDARALVQRLADGQELPKRFRTASVNVAGVDALVAGTGYTGEDGVEILTAPSNAPAIWDAATQAGAQPAGLGARDTLRLEVCFHLYGNDLSEDRGPIEAGLGWCCKEETDFVGAKAVRNAREHGTPEKLVPFALTGPGIARQGNPVQGGGVVTSGTLSPCLDIGIGMAYLPAERAVPGTPFDIDVRGKMRPAEVRTKPLYSKES